MSTVVADIELLGSSPLYESNPSRKANVIRTQKITIARRMVSRSRLSIPADHPSDVPSGSSL
jgi:hypothetical protein